MSQSARDRACTTIRPLPSWGWLLLSGTGAVAEAERAVGRFIELVGDLPVTIITKAHGRSFRDALAKVPKALPERLRKKAAA